MDPEGVRQMQLERLRTLLVHCAERVPYYRQLFGDVGFDPGAMKSLDELRRLPILTKDVVRERERDLVREDVPIDSLSAHYSGGSTGVPLRFHRDRYYLDVSEAGTYRNLMESGWRPGEMIAFFWGWNDRLASMSRLEFEARQWARRMYQFDPFRSGPADMDGWLRRWRRLRPSVAHGYASTIARFARHIMDRGERVRPLKGVFTTAERLLPEQREEISRAFGCRVFDCYGSSEVQNIAAECACGRMHVNSDFVVLEVEDADEAGTEGPLLVTSLVNYAMPFIRYRNEDRGALAAGTCECGSGFPLMDLRIGRLSDNFPLPDGRVVHGEFFTHLLYGSEGIDRFQFRQTAVDRIVLQVVPTGQDAEGRERSLRRAVEELRALAPSLSVSVEVVEDIPLSSAGKHRFTRSDVSSAGAEVS